MLGLTQKKLDLNLRSVSAACKTPRPRKIEDFEAAARVDAVKAIAKEGGKGSLEEWIHELKIIGMKLIGLLILTPLGGYFFLRVAEQSEKEWIVMCGMFFIIAVIGSRSI